MTIDISRLMRPRSIAIVGVSPEPSSAGFLMLRNLEAKEYVGHEPDGRAHRYFARVRQQAARKSAIRHLASKLFQGSADLLLTQLVADRKLSEDQVRRIREILDEKPAKERS